MTETLIVLLAILIALNPDLCMNTAKGAMLLCVQSVIPSLFPFFVCSYFLVQSGFARFLGSFLSPLTKPLFNTGGSGGIALLLGLISGYPMGAKAAVELYQTAQCSRPEAERLLAFCNNSGPLFILGAVGVGIFRNAAAGALLFLVHILSAITVGIIFRFYRYSKRDNTRTPLKKEYELYRLRKKPFGELFGDAVVTSVGSVFSVCGFIVIFSVIIALLEKYGVIEIISYLFSPVFGENISKAAARGIFEVATGTKSLLCGEPLYTMLPAAAFIIGWGGFSVHFQTISIIGKTGLKKLPYFLGKAAGAVISAIYCIIFYRFFPLDAAVRAVSRVPKNCEHIVVLVTWCLISICLMLLVIAFLTDLRIHTSSKRSAK